MGVGVLLGVMVQVLQCCRLVKCDLFMCVCGRFWFEWCLVCVYVHVLEVRDSRKSCEGVFKYITKA